MRRPFKGVWASFEHLDEAAIVVEQLRDGGEVPPGVTYYLKPNVRFYV